MDYVTSMIKTAVDEAVEEVNAVAEPAEQGLAEAPSEGAELQPPPSAQPYDVQMPSYLPPNEHTDERTAWLDGFNAVAPRAGLDRTTAQALVEAMADVNTAMQYALDLTDTDGVERYLHMAWGEEAPQILAKARAFVKRAGPELENFLSETYLGNDPGVLQALAYAQDGLFKLTKDQAAAELKKLTGDPKSKYYSLNTPERVRAVAKAQILGRLAYAGEGSDVEAVKAGMQQQLAAPEAPAKKPEPQRPPHSLDRFRTPASAGTAQGTAHDEAMKMLADRNHPLNDRNAKGHAEAVARFHQLTARLK
jgi:hypothetical protein